MDEVKIEDIFDELDNFNIIDIRDKYLYNLGSIPNSTNIPMNFLIMNPNLYLDKDETYYIYCTSGTNSKRVCAILKSKGYNVVNIIGGYNEYRRFLQEYS